MSVIDDSRTAQVQDEGRPSRTNAVGLRRNGRRGRRSGSPIGSSTPRFRWPEVDEQGSVFSINSRRSILSKGSDLSVLSLGCDLSVASAGSILSAGSAGSILSIGSAGSILSLWSAGSILSIGSAGSILSIGSAGSILSTRALGGRRRSGADDDDQLKPRRPERTISMGATALALAALTSVVLGR